VVFARYFPVDGAYAAFLVAFRIPNLLRRLVAEGAFSLAFVPVLSEYKANKSQHELKNLVDYVAGYLGLVLLVISLLGVLAAPLIIMVVAAGFEGRADARPELAVDLLRITFPYIFFISLSAFMTGILNTFNKFAIPSFTPVLLNVILIASAIWFAPLFDEPVEALAWGVLLGGIAQFLFQVPSVWRLGLLPKPKFSAAHQGVKKIIKLMIPAIFGSSVAQLNLLLNTIIASFLAIGSLGWLYYSDRFVELPLALFGVAIGTVILPKLSKDYAKEADGAFNHTMDWAIRLALLIALPAMLGLMLLAMPILATIINYGAFTWHDVEMSTLSLTTYAFGLPAFILVKVLAPGFYARQDTKTPVKIGIIAVFANMLLSLVIVLPWYLSGREGAHAGLALAVALAGYINAGLLFYTLRRDKVFQANQGWWGFMAKMSVATGLMGLVLWLSTPNALWWQAASGGDRALALVALIAVAIVVFFSALYLLGIRVRQLLNH
ncbi:MAG TPA: murein biosynthesis integral membrane protein MurJ, partial [Thiothrix sp.]|nr:murein biosynthesis integral membrane protein MurJ [Thiothrix sp.]